jgi:carboxypeptidase Q
MLWFDFNSFRFFGWMCGLVALIAGHSHALSQSFQPARISELYGDSADQLVKAAMTSRHGFNRLAEMCDTFGPRFTGSENLERAIDWALEEMQVDGFSNVRGEEVVVPRWVRGNESLTLMNPRQKSCPMLGLGGSVGTGPEGITAEVLIVDSFEDLKTKADQAKGKIVLFNAPFVDCFGFVALPRPPRWVRWPVWCDPWGLFPCRHLIRG